MTISGMVPGAAVRAPMLERFAKPALVPPENFVGNEIFPDVQVDSFLGLAPIRGNEELEAFDDDTIGLKTDFPEIMVSESSYEWELGYHGRKVIIGTVQKIKAEQARRMAIGGGSNANPAFDLEARLTQLLVKQNARHNEFLKIGQLVKEANYPADNVLDPIEIDTVTTASFLETLQTAGMLVEAAGKGPANTIVFGSGAWNGSLINANFADLLPDTAYKILTADTFVPILKLPQGNGRVLIATATYKTKKKGAITPMMNLHIWVGRTNPNPQGDGDGFGFNFWHPCQQNNQRIYVNRMVVGNAENIHIGIQNFYRPLVNDGAQGVLIPVTLSA